MVKPILACILKTLWKYGASSRYSRVLNNLTIYGQMKMSHSIHMLNIQIDTESLISHQILLSSVASNQML